MIPGGNRDDLHDPLIAHMFPVLGARCTDPAQHLTASAAAAGFAVDDLYDTYGL